VSGDLYARLKRIQEGRRERGAAGDPSAAAGDPGAAAGERRVGVAPGLPAGWRRDAPLVAVREIRVDMPGLQHAAFSSRLLGRSVRPEDLCFMDTETTGLSGGAGTSVFLTGSGSLDAGGVIVRQLLLLDFPGEPDYLERVHHDLFDGRVWVSYNGRAFDARLLETRFLMHGRRVELPDHLDLLYWSRRLWRRIIGPCSLSDIERDVLHVERNEDLPGAEIPERYFRFLDTGDADLLAAVFSHHLQDILSLVRLFFLVEDILSHAGSERPAVAYDRYALGRHLLSVSAGGELLLRRVLESPQAWETFQTREASGLLLASRLRRAGEREEAARIWRRLWDEGSIAAGIELAKHLEHQVRDLNAADTVVRGMLRAARGTPLEPELEYRLSRIQRKLLS
jgi:uncharacterized protein YprB with RNaseH-like and TPR domain